MKNSLVLLLFFCANLLVAQSSVNQYQYVIVPAQFDFLREKDEYRLNNLTKMLFEKYGFKPLQTPLLCYYDLLALKYDEENDILKEVYKVSDQGNRNLALRYDLTVPFAKYIAINQNTKLPFKRYEIGEVFRNGPVKLGRDREFIQCDVDSVGIEGQLVEAEFIALYVEAYSKLGIDVVIKYNNRKFLGRGENDMKIIRGNYSVQLM